MDLITGQTVWLSFATGFSSVTGSPVAQVGHGVVIDGENRVVKRDSGYVSVVSIHGVEHPHATEAEAWEANALYMEKQAVAIQGKAAECRRKAAEALARIEVAA